MRFVLALLVVVLSASESSAQEFNNGFDLEPGARIRIPASVSGEVPVAGEIVSVGSAYFGYTTPDDADLVFTRGYDSIRTIEVFQDSRLHGARNGALWGFYIGGIVGLIAGPFLANTISLDTGSAMAAVGASGGLFGLISGAVAGATFDTGYWKRYIVE